MGRAARALPRLFPPLAALLLILPGIRADTADGDIADVDTIPATGALLELFDEEFDEELPQEARWEENTPEGTVRDDRGFAGKRGAYLRTNDGQVSIAGLSVCIREDPGPGEYRYLSFA